MVKTHMITSLFSVLIGAAPANIVLMEGASCGSRESDELFVRVLEGRNEVSARAEMSTSSVTDKGEFTHSDVVSRTVTTGPGYVKLKWKPFSDLEEKVVKAGWVILRTVVVIFRDQVVASVAVDLTRKGGRCLLVQM